MVALPARQNTPMTLAQAPAPQIDEDRKRDMKLAWEAYRGKLPDPLKVAKGQPNDNVKQNRCAPIVDIGVSFLFGQVLKIEATDEVSDDEEEEDEPTPTPAPTPPVPGQPAAPTPVAPKPKPKKPKPTPIQDYIDGLWGDDDDKMTMLSNMGINGGFAGQVFTKLIPARGTMKYPRLVNLDPRLVRIVTLPDDCSLIVAFVIEYPSGSDWQKRQIVARMDPNSTLEDAGEEDLDDTWTITNYTRQTRAGQASDWQQMGASVDWPYPFPPIFTNKNLPNPNEAWGTPDLTPDIIELNKAINFQLSNLSRIIKFHGHPKAYATGVRAEQITTAIDDILCLPSPESKLQALAAMENFTGILSSISDLRSSMDEQSRVPAVALGRLTDLPKGNISGVALKLLLQPLTEKTIQKQRLYGSGIREVTRAALVVGGLIGIEDFEDYPIEIHWPNLLPIDDLSAAQTAQLLEAIGVSKSTLMQELGYDPDDEADKSAQEDAKKVTMFSRGQGFPPGVQPGQTPPAQVPQQQAAQQTAVGMGAH